MPLSFYPHPALAGEFEFMLVPSQDNSFNLANFLYRHQLQGKSTPPPSDNLVVVNTSYILDHQTSAALSLVALAALVALGEHEHYSYYNLPIFNLSLSLLTLVLITPSVRTYAKIIHTKIASIQSYFAMTNLAFLLTLMCLIYVLNTAYCQRNACEYSRWRCRWWQC